MGYKPNTWTSFLKAGQYENNLGGWGGSFKMMTPQDLIPRDFDWIKIGN